MKQLLQTSVLAIVLILTPITKIASQYQYPFQNPNLPAEERINNILSLMTVEEKVACLSTDPSVPRLSIKGSRHAEGLHGVAYGGPSNWGSRNPMPTTIFPQAYGLAETWDTSLLRLVGEIEGYDLRYIFQNKKYKRGGLVIRAPNADIGRDPRWGRTEECYGEDAWFNSRMVVSIIKGFQGDHPKYWQSASLMKHFLANSNENGRDSTSSNFDERLWREYYSYPFYKGVTEGGSQAYMAAYNSYNGIPCTVNPMLKDITVKDWGVNGIICTDGGAFELLITKHKYFPNLGKAAEGCIKAGINQFLDRKYKEGIDSALANKYITVNDIDSVIRGSFRVMIKLGLLDPPEMVPYSSIGIKDTIDPWTTEKNKYAVKLVTQKSIVLLKNEKEFLPLDKNKIKTIAVIGPRADKVLLDWYSGTPPYTISPLEGIKNKVGEGIKVLFARNNSNDSAINIAKIADIAIVCVGNHTTCDAGWAECPTPSDGKEAVDRKSINLEQEELIRAVFQANPKTMVVLISNFAYSINWTHENIPAILHLTHNSQELGSALADAIFGDINPGGRLIQTWPRTIDQLPPMMDYNIRNGRTYMYFKGEPLYPFGYGLSYTTFAYSNLKVTDEIIKKQDKIIVSASIKNTGKCAGDEVAQLYIQHLDSKIKRPIKELKGFTRITLKPGETRMVHFELKIDDLKYWNTSKQNWTLEKDKIKIMVGTSSANIKLENTIEVQ
jgi:beta-glucosidase